MSSRLEQTTTRLAQTERVAAWRQVARRFAHELKNPIQPILVSLYRIEKLLSSTDSYEKIEEPLKAASDELNHLRDLAERFSQLAKLPAPSLKETSLNDLLTSVAGLYKEQLAPFGFELSLPSEDVTANVDHTYLREALYNIIQNAIDASKPGQPISLELRAEADRARIILRDTGEGMDQQTVTSARLPYFTTKETGTGLGLAIVEKSVNEMGGEVYVESEKGKGTTIILSLPREVANHEA
jgi:nitrogen fixation/metabolism regulation signal transduction histidine kinase